MYKKPLPAEISNEEVEGEKKEKKHKKPLPKKVVRIYLSALLVFTGFIIYNVESNTYSGASTYSPGPLIPVQPTGEVQEEPSTEYFAPTVTIRPISNFEILQYKLSGRTVLMNSKSVSKSKSSVNVASLLDMEASKKNAVAAAVAFNGGFKAESDVVITSIDESGLAFKSGLQVGTNIYKVNGVRVNNTDDFLRLINKRSQLQIETIKPAKNYTVNTGGRELGISIINSPISKLPKIDVSMSKVGGSSAGLVMSLAIVDALNPGPISKYKKVSGSASIQVDGSLGVIAGIDEKLREAETSGIDVFFISSKENYKFKSTRMQIVKVSNLKDAVAFLKKA